MAARLTPASPPRRGGRLPWLFHGGCVSWQLIFFISAETILGFPFRRNVWPEAQVFPLPDGLAAMDSNARA